MIETIILEKFNVAELADSFFRITNSRFIGALIH